MPGTAAARKGQRMAAVHTSVERPQLQLESSAIAPVSGFVMVVCGPFVEMIQRALRSLSRWLNGRTRTATRTLSPDIARDTRATDQSSPAAS
jgi:hypothetical protein